jgi:hypothetical protein
MKIQFSERLKSKGLRLANAPRSTSIHLGPRILTPTLIGCWFLKNVAANLFVCSKEMGLCPDHLTLSTAWLFDPLRFGVWQLSPLNRLNISAAFDCGTKLISCKPQFPTFFSASFGACRLRRCAVFSQAHDYSI